MAPTRLSEDKTPGDVEKFDPCETAVAHPDLSSQSRTGHPLTTAAYKMYCSLQHQSVGVEGDSSSLRANVQRRVAAVLVLASGTWNDAVVMSPWPVVCRVAPCSCVGPG
ncbi:hypothetical protein J6590_075147 [Homalodisca vitripennis]|nr:hypothetical protein J6590_075147 [Homalodisca vitripennis]